ncbi:nuclear pore complex protein Nup50 isoform X2 [Bufo bufo]|uniref:nuclear pore complex protein Nup50 isoform X2 n=1 Tax=Bufo bufo TaxID=8384 RepID=UPI001ABE198F|nr:nuclear pore complex protein Nup50 isoform X2 [Bufo bufo]
MAKRLADKELTDRNWDQEEESEDAGTFSVASQDVLKSREIKKAKRRNVGSESEVSGAFKGFKGLFPTSGASFGGFGSDSAAKPLQGLTNGSRTTSLFTSKPAGESKQSFGSVFTNGPTSSTTDGTFSTAKTNGEKPSPTSGSGPNRSVSSSDYNKQLASLNCSVRDWIVKHVNANPLCDLTPIFKDYDKHLSTIEQKYGVSTDSGSESDCSKGTPTIPSFLPSKLETKQSFSFTCKESKSEQPAQSSPEKKSPPASLFSFGQKTDTSSFGSFSSGTAAGFSFTAGAAGLFGKDSTKNNIGPSSFSVQSVSTNKTEESGGGADEEEEPPKVVIQEVKEDDAFYSKKCKLFYKKDNEFKEKGVGTLHLKTLGDQKTQLLVRADTNLGNILLNILVQPSMPCSRTGKNNVMIVCVPNPPIAEENPTAPVTMLIRVKTTEDADKLHKIILEKKGA